MSITNKLSELVILPLGDLFTGQSVAKKLKFLNQSQWWPEEELRKFQEDRLRQLIKHSVETVPYYKKLFQKNGLKIEDIKTVDDLKKIPVLTKEIIKKEGLDKFTSSAISPKKRIHNSSSGSTGEPLFYFSTKEAYSMNIAANLRGWFWMGFQLGDRYIKLSQNLRKKPIKKLQDKLSNNLYLATNPLIDSNFDFILKEIERYQPKIIRCYPDPLLFLARYKKSRPEFSFKPHAITTTGNTLFPDARQEIEEAFGCKIFDSYSCEGNSTVFECPTHTCYHSSEEYGITEIVDNEGSLISNGIGKLISTDLWNLAHPFIRYDTQDLVEVGSELCTCGRYHLKINRIMGRDNDVIVTSKNRFIVHNFTSFFTREDILTYGKVEKFQVRKKNDCIEFILVVNGQFNSAIEQFIIDYWTKEMGENVIVSLQDEIPLTKSGKHRFIINE